VRPQGEARSGIGVSFQNEWDRAKAMQKGAAKTGCKDAENGEA